MGHFFHGWRRKIGVMTLLMACAFAGAWVRSQSVNELLFLWDRFIVISAGGKFAISNEIRFILPPNRTSTFSADTAFGDRSFHQLSLDDHFQQTYQADIPMIPYWGVAIPLTLYSAWLLLVTPRKTKLIATIQPEPSSHA